MPEDKTSGAKPARRSRTASARSTARDTVAAVKAKLPEATTRNVAIGAAAAAAAVGVGVAATVGRSRISKASSDLVAGVKKRVHARGSADSKSGAMPNA